MEKQNSENFLVNLIKWGIYFSLLTPLVVSQEFFYAFIVPKTIFFRIVVNLIFVAYLVLILNFPKYRPKFNALSIALSVFILITIISSIFGVNFQKSFWSVYERETGILTFLHLFAYFIILTSILKKERDWYRVFLVSVIIAVICCLFAVASNSPSTKGAGTIGNSSFLGTYLLFNIFFALILLLNNRFNGKGLFSIIALIIMIPVLISIKAKAATGSFFGGLGLIFIGSLFFSKKKKFKILSFVIPILLVVLLASLYLYIPKVNNFVDSQLNSMKARYIVWDMAWKGFLEKPILGWGLENFNIVFVKHFDPRLYLKEFGGEIWFDRSHNIVLDTLVTTGVLGLISYLSIFFVSIFYLLKRCFKEKETNLNLVIIALLAAYFVQNITVFDVISSYMTFFFTLAFIYFLQEKDKPEGAEGKIIENKLIKGIIYSLIFVFAVVSLYFGNIQPAKSATYTLKSIVSKTAEGRIDAYKKAIKISRFNIETDRYFANTLISFSLQENIDKNLLKEGLQLSKEEIEKEIQKNELDFRSYLSWAKTYIAGYRITSDEKELEKAEEILRKAIELSPRNPQAYWLLSDVKLKQDDFEGSIESLEEAIELEPRILDSYWYLISSYIARKNYDEVMEVIEKSEKAGVEWAKDLEKAERILYVYEEMKKPQESIDFCRKILEKHPEDAKTWFRMAIALFNVGDREEAKEAAQRAIQIDPNLEDKTGDALKTLLQEN